MIEFERVSTPDQPYKYEYHAVVPFVGGVVIRREATTHGMNRASNPRWFTYVDGGPRGQRRQPGRGPAPRAGPRLDHPARCIDRCTNTCNDYSMNTTTATREATTVTTTRYAIRATREHGTLYVFALQALTNPAWTDSARNAATWASKAGAQARARKFNLTNVEIVPMTVTK